MGGYLGKSVGGFTSVTEKRQTFNITTTTTQLTGLSYTPTKEEVHVNGIRYVRDVDYTANDGLTITLTNPLLNGDTAIVKSFPSFDVADTVSASNGGTFAGNVQMSGTLGVSGNVHINPSTQAPLVVENPASNSLGAYVKIRDGNSTAGQHTWIGRSAHDTYVYANNTDLAMKITGGSSDAGFVTKPNQPSFKAHGTSNQYLDTTPIEFPSISGRGGHNIGSHYNTSNYRFTAPVAGRYFFYVHVGIIRIQATTAACYPQLRINGAAIIYSYVKMTGSIPDHVPAHLSAVVNLAASDYVDVTFVGGSNSQYYNGPGELSFQGYLLG